MPEGFATMLRRHRLAASLTQEQLAERALVSATAIAALERGRRRAPRLSTIRQLGRALELSEDDLAALAQAASAESAEPTPAEGPEERESRTAPRPTAAEPPPPPGGVSTFPLPSLALRHWRAGFVGRSAECQALFDAFVSRRRFTLVLGEAGIGKTRLVAEFARRVAEDEVAVLWGRCREERLGPYLPFVEVLRHVVEHGDPAALRQAVGDRGELQRLVPELEDRLGPLRSPARADAGTEQRLLFESVAGLLQSLGPVVVVLDDLHWATEADVALLRYLVAEPGLDDLVLVGTARHDDLGAEQAGLLDLDRHADTGRLRLTTLGAGDLAALIAEVTGSQAAQSLVESVAATTEGNPFFAEEMTLHLLDTGMVERRGGGLELRGGAGAAGVPERVRDTLLRRLLAVPPGAMDLLMAGAVIGRTFDVTLAGAAAGLEASAVIDAADDCLLSGMVIENGPGRLLFRHSLVQDTVGDRMSSLRRASVHRKVAELLESWTPEDPTTVADVARHWAAVAAVDRTAAPVAADWSMRAGDVALAAAAADEAIACYEEASSLWAASTRGHADAMVRLGTALQYRGRAEEADQRFRSALKVAEGLGDAELQARAAIGLGRRYPYWDIDHERVAALEGALGRLKDPQDVLALTVMAMLVTHLIAGFTAEQADRRDQLAQAVRDALDHDAVTPDVLRNLGETRVYDSFEDPVALARVAKRLVAGAEAESDLRVMGGARLAQVLSALDRGEMGELRPAAERFKEVAEQLDEPRELAQADTLWSAIATIEGRYEDAAALSEEAVERSRSSGDLNAELVYFAQGILRGVDLGQASDMLPLLVAATDYQHIVSVTTGIALCAALAGDEELARSHLERFKEEGLPGVPRGADRLTPLAFLAHACSLVGRPEEAGALYEALVEEPVAAIRVGPALGWWGPLRHHLGTLCRTMGRPEEAQAHLEAALKLERRMGARPFEARTMIELARVLLAEKGSGTKERRRRATELAGGARSLAEELGAPGIVAQLETLEG